MSHAYYVTYLYSTTYKVIAESFGDAQEQADNLFDKSDLEFAEVSSERFGADEPTDDQFES